MNLLHDASMIALGIGISWFMALPFLISKRSRAQGWRPLNKRKRSLHLVGLAWSVLSSTAPHDCAYESNAAGGYQVSCATTPFYKLTYKGKAVVDDFQGETLDPLQDYADKMNKKFPGETKKRRPKMLWELPI